ncbi:hypothetical protein GLYMA_18G122801v4 [Glycine max]|nr:hypothetical protein GLYMA_18G122801v4 [Glycine max]KAH1154239.1 hypothetical protein GYH30_049760 [Glycine max]
MHSLFFFFFICCSLWSLLEDLTEPLRTFSPATVTTTALAKKLSEKLRGR